MLLSHWLGSLLLGRCVRRSPHERGRRAVAWQMRTVVVESELLEDRTLLSPAATSGIADTAADDVDAGDHEHLTFPSGWLGDFYAAPLEDGGHEADPLTIVLDFNEPAQANTMDGFGNVVSTFDVTAYGFAVGDFNLVTNTVLETVREHYFTIPTSEVNAMSPLPPGRDLALEFVIGDIGSPPSNGATEYYYLQIGTDFVGGGPLGVAGLNAIRDSGGNPGAAIGSVVGSIFTDNIQGLTGLTPSNALTSGDLTFTANAIGGTTSHEAGHALSLLHLNKAGSVTPNGLPPIMGTGAIDLPNQDRINDREFAITGQNAQAGGATQNHIQQLIDAIGLHNSEDLGDAPNSYGTLRGSNGARHIARGPMLGATRDTEADGQPTGGADGDDTVGSTDEDGFVSQSTFAPGEAGVVTVNVQGTTGTHFVNAWIDFNNNGSFTDAGEQIATDLVVNSDGNQVINFTATAGAVVGDRLLRVRLDSAGGLGPTGRADDGEVEDHLVTVSLASTIYVDSNWLGTPIGMDPDGAGPATSFGTDSFAVIQDGLDAVPVSGFVVVFPGTGPYSENLSIDRQLTLMGSTGTASDVVVDASGGLHGIVISTATDVIIQDLRVDGAMSEGIRSSMLGLDLTLDNVESLNNGRHGVLIQDADSLLVDGGSYSNNNSDADAFGDGIHAESNMAAVTLSVTLQNNVTATGNVRGVFFNVTAGAGSYSDTGTNASNNTNHGIQLAGITGSVVLTGVTANNNDSDAIGGGDGIHMDMISGPVTFVNVTAGGNDPGVFIDGAPSFSDTNGVYNNNGGDGIQLLNITGDVTLAGTTLQNNGDDGFDVNMAAQLVLSDLNMTGNTGFGGNIAAVSDVDFTSTTGGNTADLVDVNITLNQIEHTRGALVQDAIRYDNNLSAVTIQTQDGDDEVQVQFGPGLPMNVLIDGGPPNASDSVTVLGTGGNDVIIAAGTMVSDGVDIVDLTNVEHLTIDVTQGGDDDVVVNQSVTLSGGSPTITAVSDGVGTDELFVNTPLGMLAQTIDVDAAMVAVAGEVPVLYSMFSHLFVDGDDGLDTFTVAPSMTTAITIDGGPPSLVMPGDTLNFEQPAGETSTLTPGPPGDGTWTTTGGFSAVDFTDIETTHLGGDIVVNGTPGDDTLVLTADDSLSGTYSLNGSPPTSIAGVTSFTFNGMAGDDIFRLVNSPGVFRPVNGIFYDGGPPSAGPGDSIELAGTVDNIVYDFDNASDGSIAFQDDATYAMFLACIDSRIPIENCILADNTRLRFSNIEPISDTTMSGNRAFVFGDTDDVIVVDEMGALDFQIRSAASETVDFSAPTNDVLIFGDGGDDAIYTFAAKTPAQDFALFGGDGRDTLRTGDGADTLSGGNGANFLYGGGGIDVVRETADSDFLLTNPQVAFTGTDGKPALSIFSQIEQAHLTGGFSKNTLDATAFTLGSVTLDGGVGEDTLHGSPQADSLFGNGGDDLLNGYGGGDTLDGGLDDDTANGGSGADCITGGEGDDVLHGGGDDDTLGLGTGNDQINGGGGRDLVFAQSTHPSGTGPIDIDLSMAGVLTIPGDGGSIAATKYTLSNVETAFISAGADPATSAPVNVTVEQWNELGNVTLEGSDFDDTLRGAGNADSIIGNAGNDMLFGLGEADTIRGGPDNDVIRGGNGLDFIEGNAGDDDVQGQGGNDLIFGGNAAGTEGGANTLAGSGGADTVIGGIEDDTINGNGGADVLSGGLTTGGEVLDGGGGPDLITGSALADTIVGGGGSDTIAAGDDADTVVAGGGRDVVDAGGGADTVRGGSGLDTIDGGLGDDALFGQGGGDLILAGDDNDFVSGASGNDTIFGGDGDDEIIGGQLDDVLDGEAGSDTVRGSTGADTITAGSDFDADTVDGGADVDVLHETTDDDFDLGDSKLVRGAAVDTLISIDAVFYDNRAGAGGKYFDASAFAGDEFSGPATLLGSAGADCLFGGDGADTIDGGAGSDTLLGNGGDDTIFTGDDLDDDTADGGDGDDSIIGGATADTIDGGMGSDTISGGDGDDVLNGNEDGDVILGGDGDDTISGGSDAAADSIDGGTGNDVIDGEDGDDTLTGNVGDDVITGGPGTDLLVETADAHLTLTDSTLVASGGFGSDTLMTIENVILTGGTDDNAIYADAFTAGSVTLLGGDGDDTLNGGHNSDSLDGGQGDDQIAGDPGGGAGADTIDGNGGRDVLSGNAGDDVIIGGGGGDSIDAGSGADSVNGGNGRDTITAGNGGADTVFAGGGNDSITSTGSDDDRLYGEDGNDTIDAGDGDDSLSGGNGDDFLIGGDPIAGNDGDDVLVGSLGADTLFGGSGDDSLAGGDGNDTLDGEAGADTVDGQGGSNAIVPDLFDPDAAFVPNVNAFLTAEMAVWLDQV